MASFSSLVLSGAALALTSSVIAPEALRAWGGGSGRPSAVHVPVQAWRPPAGALHGRLSLPVEAATSEAVPSATPLREPGKGWPAPGSAAGPPPQATPRPGWRWPLSPAPRVVRPFERPRSAWGTGHRGVDLEAAAAQEVRAAAGGRVTHVGVISGRSTITVTHRSGVRTTYEPVVPGVALGQVVPAGAVLGAVAAAGSHCERQPSRGQATCLHFGALRGRTYLDPLALLRGGPVVLLPMR